MLCKHHFSKNGQVFFHIFWVVTLIMQSRRLRIRLLMVLLQQQIIFWQVLVVQLHGCFTTLLLCFYLLGSRWQQTCKHHYLNIAPPILFEAEKKNPIYRFPLRERSFYRRLRKIPISSFYSDKRLLLLAIPCEKIDTYFIMITVATGSKSQLLTLVIYSFNYYQ